jgi:hypothetical protein
MNQIYYASFKRTPIIYTKLYNCNKITIEEYRFLRKLWNTEDYCINSDVGSLLNEFFGVRTITKTHRNSFNSSIKKLTKYGLIEFSKSEFRIASIKLSTNIFAKTQKYFSRYLNGVDLLYSVNMRRLDKEQIIEYIDLCNEAGVEPIEMSDVYNIVREPIIGIRSPIIGIREPIVGIRKPIINHKNNEYFPNKGRKLNFNAKKYEGLTENEKKQLESMARFGQAYVDRKLKQMRKNQFSVVESELENSCLNEFVPYYENLVCKATGKISYTALPHQKKKLSRNWSQLFACYKMCVENDYDWKIYLEAQFESFKNWKTGNLKYPVPNNLSTERAIKAYENYVYHNETAYQNEGWETKLSSKEVGSYQDEVSKILESDMGIVDNLIKYSLKKSFNKTFKNVDKTRSDLDKLYYSKAVQLSWEDLSIEFWSIVPQMDEFLESMYGRYDSLDGKIDLYKDLMSNSAKINIISEVASGLKIPKLYGVIDIDDKMT